MEETGHISGSCRLSNPCPRGEMAPFSPALSVLTYFVFAEVHWEEARLPPNSLPVRVIVNGSDAMEVYLVGSAIHDLLFGCHGDFLL